MKITKNIIIGTTPTAETHNCICETWQRKERSCLSCGTIWQVFAGRHSNKDIAFYQKRIQKQNGVLIVQDRSAMVIKF
mgnify:CR=1 FL=1